MLLVGALSVIEPHSPVQLLCGLLICIVWMLITLRSAPFIEDGLDQLEFLCSISLTLTLLFALLRSMDENAREESNRCGENAADGKYFSCDWQIPDQIFSAVLTAVNVMPFVTLAYTTLRRWNKYKKEIAAMATAQARRLRHKMTGKSKVVPTNATLKRAELAWN
jgi:hypothetical protein